MEHDDANTIAQIALMREFVHLKLEPWPEFVAALIVGSVAHGEARPDSDIDCILVFDRMNDAIVPAEFVWVPDTDTFHTIFEVEASEVGGIQIDATRVVLDDIQHRDWPEEFKHELAHALLLFDRSESVTTVLRDMVAYPDALRAFRIQEHLSRTTYLLEKWRVLNWIDRGGVASAHDQLTAAFEELIQLLHALNREWLPWRSRWVISAQKLALLPNDYRRKSIAAMTEIAPTQQSVTQRRDELASMLDDTRGKLQSAGLISDPDEAFVSAHPGLGYAHNFEAWREAHLNLLKIRDVPGEPS